MRTDLTIPSAWRAALGAVQSVVPQAVLAGGALRDRDNGKKVKDLDIFLPVSENTWYDLDMVRRAMTKLESAQHRRGWYKTATEPRARTRYKGVHKHGKNSWVAVIKDNKTVVRLGTFHTAIEAARAYDAAVDKYHGSYGQKNNV